MSSATAAPPAGPAKKGSGKWLLGCAIAGVVGCFGIAVVGILAAIAIPNFIKYQCKSKQAEARSNLMALRTAEESFRAEHGFYTSDLVALQFSPFGTPRYLYGFADSGPGLAAGGEAPPDYDETRQDTEHAGLSEASMANMVNHDGSKLTPEDLPDSSYVERDHFLAGAVGDVGGGDKLDVWTIDETGSLQNESNGCDSAPAGLGDD